MKVDGIVKDFRTHRLFRVAATLLAALTVASSSPMTWAASGAWQKYAYNRTYGIIRAKNG